MSNTYKTGMGYTFSVGANPITDPTSLAGIDEYARTVQSVTRGSTAESVDGKIRGLPTDPGYNGKGQSVALGGTISRTITVNCMFAPEDPALAIVQANHNNQTPMSFAALSGPKTESGVKGWVGNCIVKTFNMDESSDTEVTASFEIAPTDVFNYDFAVA